MKTMPKGMAKQIFDLTLSSSKTVELGVCLNTFTPYAMLVGDRVGGKSGEKIRLRMTLEELQGLQSDAIFTPSFKFHMEIYYGKCPSGFAPVSIWNLIPSVNWNVFQTGKSSHFHSGTFPLWIPSLWEIFPHGI